MELFQRKILSIFPYVDTIVTAEVKGSDLWSAFENSVSKLPILEGRFLQVSSTLQVTFDSSKEPGQRVLSMSVNGRALDKSETYKVATKTIMLEGKDGFDSLKGATMLMEPDDGQLLSLMIRHHFVKLHVVETLRSYVASPTQLAVSRFKAAAKQHKKELPTISPALDGRLVDVTKK